MNDKVLKLDKIFNIFSVLYLPIVIVLFKLNLKYGVGVADGIHAELGNLSYVLSFFVLLIYLILSLTQMILLLKTRAQISYFGISFLNIVFCSILIFFTLGGVFFLVFGFVICAPIILSLSILWLICWINAIKRIYNPPENIAQETKEEHYTTYIKKSFYCILLLCPILFIAFQANYILHEAIRPTVEKYKWIKREKSMEEFKKKEKQKDIKARKSHEYKQFLTDNENFYNAVKMMHIIQKNKSAKEVAEEYKREFYNYNKWSSVLGEYTIDKDEFDTNKRQYLMVIYINGIKYNAEFNLQDIHPRNNCKSYDYVFKANSGKYNIESKYNVNCYNDYNELYEKPRVTLIP